MELSLKAKLKNCLQKFLDDHQDEITDGCGIWLDETVAGKNAEILATACECVFDAGTLEKSFTVMQ